VHDGSGPAFEDAGRVKGLVLWQGSTRDGLRSTILAPTPFKHHKTLKTHGRRTHIRLRRRVIELIEILFINTHLTLSKFETIR
jgi:hypothetical protein